MFIEVIKADYLDGYRVQLLFNNGETRIVDSIINDLQKEQLNRNK